MLQTFDEMSKLIFTVAAIFAATATALDLPEFLHVCKRNDPNINDCIKRSVENLKPYLVNGVAEYNLPTLEPLLLKEVPMLDSHGGIRLTLRNVKVFGASDFTVASMSADMQNFIFILDIDLPHLYIDGQYDVDGRILLLPINGHGQITGNFTNCSGAVKFRMTLYTDAAGVERLHVEDDFYLKITVTKGHLNLENLFGGDKAVGEVINSAINSNFGVILNELKPSIENSLADSFKEVAKSIIDIFTYDQLFPLN